MEEENLDEESFCLTVDDLGCRWERGDKEPGCAVFTNIEGDASEKSKESDCVDGESKQKCHNGNPFRGATSNVAQDKTGSDKSNAESDMDIGGNDTDSDPEFLPVDPTNGSDHNASSFRNDSKQAAEYGETELNEDFLSYIFAPEDVIIERQDNKSFFYCNVCHCNIHNSTKNIKVHKRGKSHKAAVIKYKKAIVTAAKNATSNNPGAYLAFLDCYIERYKPRGYYCRVCNFIAEKIKGMDEHVHGKWHETNICIMKEREKMTQPKESTEKGKQDEMKELDEEFFKLLEMNRLHSWNLYSSTIADEASKNYMSSKVEPGYSMQGPSLYSSQNDFQQNQFYQNLENQDARTDQQTTSLLNTHFVIKNESHAQVVIGVIDSLLQTYLKHQLRQFPKLHFKSQYDSLETEESTYNINRRGRGRITEQSFHDSQNSKNKYQSSFISNTQRNSSDLYLESSDNYIENSLSKRYASETFYNDRSQGIPMDSKNYKPYKSFCAEDESHCQPHYGEQMKKPRNTDTMRQYEEAVEETQSTFDESFPFRNSYNQGGSTKRMRYNQSFMKDSYGDYNEDSTLPQFARQIQSESYTTLQQNQNSVYEGSAEQNKPFTSNVNKQYRNLKKENNFARNNRQREFYARDFSENYNRGSNTGERFSRGTQQKFRSSNNFTHN